MNDFTAQRINMVESQVRPSDVTDRRIIRAMLEVPREQFVPDALRSIAYMDTEVSLPSSGGSGRRALLAPRVFAKLVQEARIEPGMTVLDVGCATGYSTAVLARLAKRVVGLECDAELAAKAKKTLQNLAVSNAVVSQGALQDGLASEGPFDAVLLNGAVPAVPQVLLEQLAEGGRLVAVRAEGNLGQAVVWTRVGRTSDARVVFDAGAQPLPGFERKPEFVF